MKFTNTSEKGFQKYIVNYLTEKQGYAETPSTDYN